MAFTVTLYTFAKAPNSTAQPSGSGTDYSCVSNNDFNIISPRVPLQIGADANPTGYNYAKIAAWNRYYWIRSWAWEDGLWVAYMDVDALASWKTGIGNMSAYVLRSYYEGDETVPDTMWPQIVDVGYEKDETLSTPWNPFLTNGSFVVGVAGSGATCYYWFTFSMLDVFLKYLYSSDYADEAVGWLPSSLNPELKAQLNPLQYLTSIVWLPFTLTSAPVAATHLKIGYVDVIGKIVTFSDSTTATVSAYEINVLTTQYYERWTIKRHPYAPMYGKWASANLAEISALITPFGNLSLDPLIMATNDYLDAEVNVDSYTGAATLLLTATGTAGSTIISYVHGQVGIPIQLSSVIAPGTGIASLLPTVASGVSAVTAGIATGGAAGVAIGAAGVAAAGASAIGQIGRGNVAHANTIGGTPSVVSLGQYWGVYYKWYNIADTDYQDKGRPLCKVKTLSTIPGYQLCANVEVRLSCTREEEQMIKTALESGYFYE